MSIDRTETDEEDFAILLDRFDSAYQSGDASNFWLQLNCSESMRQRLREATNSVDLLERYYAQSQTRISEFTIADTGLALQRLLNTRPTQLGRFQLSRELGRGGFGVVYLADDPMLKRQVAIKIPRVEAIASTTARLRFIKEAEIAAGLDHNHIVPIFEVGENDEVIYLVSLYCPGTNLTQWLQLNRGVLTIPQALDLVLRLSDAIAHCHERNVLHRDLKPANVLLFPTPCGLLPFLPRINDFGLAKVMEASLSDTSSSMLLGTPMYMSPEQASSQHEQICPATDVHALGLILYELLVGEPPFVSSSFAVLLDQIRNAAPVAPRTRRPEIPHDLETICLKCLQKSPLDRYVSGTELYADLLAHQRGEAIDARTPTWADRLTRWVVQKERLREASTTVMAINFIIALMMSLSLLLFNFQLTPFATQGTFVYLIGTVAAINTGLLSLIIIARWIRQGARWAIAMAFTSGIFLTAIASGLTFGIFLDSSFLRSDTPGFRVVFMAIAMLYTIQTIVSGFALQAASALKANLQNIVVDRRSVKRQLPFVLAVVGAAAFWPSLLPSEWRTNATQDDQSFLADTTSDRADGATFGSDRAVYISPIEYDGKSAKTLEAWILPRPGYGMICNVDGKFALFCRAKTKSKGPSVQLPLSEDRLLILLSDTQLVADTWHHLAVTYSGSKVQLFVDGIPNQCSAFIDDGTASNRVAMPDEIHLETQWSNIGLTIGANDPNASTKHHYPFVGKIREIRLSEGVLYTESFVPEKSLEITDRTQALFRFTRNRLARVDDATQKSPPAILTTWQE